MSDSKDRQALRLPLAAAAAGFAWGYLRHRGQPRQVSLALMQAIEWFVACGGATVLLEVLRDSIDADDIDELTERVTHTTQRVTDQFAP